LSTAHQQLNFTLTQVQQQNDRLRARRFQLELERGDRPQRIVDLQQQVEEAEVHVAALQAIVALQPLPPVQAHPEEQHGLSDLDQTSQAGPPLPTPPASPTYSGASVGN
jgi:hypothetical protein